MKFDWLKKELERHGFKLASMTFLEDGYEVRVKLTSNKYLEETEILERLDNLDYRGYVCTETRVNNFGCTMTLVPTKVDDMMNFIWKYVEKYGRKEQRLVDILAEGYCVLERALEYIPEKMVAEKATAMDNYNRCIQML